MGNKFLTEHFEFFFNGYDGFQIQYSHFCCSARKFTLILYHYHPNTIHVFLYRFFSGLLNWLSLILKGQFEDIRESAILEGYRCKDGQCDGFLLRDSDDKGFVCQQCGLLRDKEEIKNNSSELDLMSEKASMSLSHGRNTEAIMAYKMIEELQLKLYHPFSINLMRTRETLLKLFMEAQVWEEALAYCRLTIPIYERVYPKCHPLLGLQYYMCGKLEWLLGETELAVRSLTKALDVLRITHGTKSPFMMELLSKLDEARQEASYKFHPQIED